MLRLSLLFLSLLLFAAPANAMPRQGHGGPIIAQPSNKNIKYVALLNVPLIPQATCCWCWAASGDMVMTYTGHPTPQCKQAEYQFSQPSCCGANPPGKCVSGGIVEIAHYGYTYQQLGGNSALTPSQIEDEISTHHMPWILNPNGPGFGHVTVGVGYETFNGKLTMVAVNDPWPPGVGDFYWESYASYKCGFSGGVCHTEGYDLYAIVPPPPFTPKLPLLATYDFKIPPEEISAALDGDPNPMRAAQAALPLLAETVTREAASRLQIESAESVARAQLDPPVQEFNVSADRLRGFKGGAAEELIQQVPGMMVPVEIGGRIRAVIRLQQEGGRWKFATFGGPAFAAAWQRVAQRGDFLVEVQGVEVAFAARRAGGQIFLKPLFSEPTIGLEAGKEQTASVVLARLAPIAANQRPNILLPQQR